MADIPIVTAKDNFNSEYLYIALSKRKAWNLLLREGGIVCPNKAYIKHNGLYWHNNKLLKALTCDNPVKEAV